MDLTHRISAETSRARGTKRRGRLTLLMGLLLVVTPAMGEHPLSVRAALRADAATRSLYGCALTDAAGLGAASVAVGDFNRDGTADLVVANAGNGSFGNTVSVLLGRGHGAFQPQQTYIVGRVPWSVAVSDFNHDGAADVVTANAHDNTVSVLVGRGDGSFQPQQTYAVGFGPQSVVVADLNGDGTADLVTADLDNNTVSVLVGKGDGSFQAQQTYAAGALPNYVTVGDLNGDGIADLVTANYVVKGTVSVLLGNGDGSFQSQQTYTVGSAPYGVAVADLDGDGTADLVTADYGVTSPDVSVLLHGGPCVTPPIPSSGYPTSSVALSGSNYDSGERVAVYWDSTRTQPLTETSADASGAFTATLRVPLAPFGTHALIAVGQRTAIAFPESFQVTPRLRVQPPSGSAGTVVTAMGMGFGAGETVTLTWRYHGTTVLGTTTTSGMGSFGGPTAIRFTVPTSALGAYTMCGTGQTTLAQNCATFTVTG